jgi:magnesium-transporting ATPase (P-type)
MDTSSHSRLTWLLIVRWTARLSALSFLFFALTYLVGSYMDPSPRPGPQNARDYFFLSLMGLTLLGYLLGLWWEGVGGFIGLAASIVFLTWLSFVITIDLPCLPVLSFLHSPRSWR